MTFTFTFQVHITSVQFISVAQSCPTLGDPMNRSTPGLPVHHHLPEFTQTRVHRVCNAIQPSHPLSSPFPPAPNPSQRQSLLHESALRMRWPKYWSFSFSIIPSKEIPGLISFRMDWLDLLAVQGNLKSLLQHHSSKASILRKKKAQLSSQSNSHIHTTGKTIALTRRTFVGKVMSLLFNMLSRLVIVKKSESEVAQSCPTLRDPVDCSLPGFSVHGIFQARVLEWVAIAFPDNKAR